MNREIVGHLDCAPIGINPGKSPSMSVGARAVWSGGEGLYGRPPSRSAMFTPLVINPTSYAGDHKGPPHPSQPPSPLRRIQPCFVRLMLLGRLDCAPSSL